VEKYCRAREATDDNVADIAFCVLNASEYVILIAFLLQQWLHECVSVLCYAYIGCVIAHIYV